MAAFTSLSLIGSAIGWGSGRLLGESGPRSLRDFGLDRQLQELGLIAVWHDIVEAQPHLSDYALEHQNDALPFVAAHAARLASAVRAVVASSQLPVTIGGDHSTAIGHYAGLVHGLAAQSRSAIASGEITPPAASTQILGIIWIDAHADCNRPETSPSMACHGMALATVMGHGAPELTRLTLQEYIQPAHVCLIGTRAVDPGEQQFLERHQIRVFSPAELSQRGIAAVLNDAVAIATHGTAGFGLSIDLDAFDLVDAPGVAIPEPDGLRVEQVLPELSVLIRHPQLLGIEISEYVPEHDVDQKTARLVRDLLSLRRR